MEGDIIMNPDNIEINNINKQCYDMGLDTDTFIENLVTLIIYNWQLTDAIDSLELFTTSHMWNSLRHTDNSEESSTIYYQLI